MKPKRRLEITIAFLLILMSSAGCNRSSGPPAPLPVEQLPAALEKVFSQAQAESKELAGQVAVAVRTQDYSMAFVGLQALAGMPKLNKEQVSVTTRGLLTVNGLLQSAQSQGDPKAAAALKEFRLTK